MPLEIELEKHARLHIVTLRGRLDSAGTPAFEASMKSLIEAGETRILIDCMDLRYVSSVGLGVFVGSAQALGSAGGALYFAALTQHVRSVFEMVGFLGLFEIYSSRSEAMESAALQDSGG
jgi:anti-sigma B factor antagonist